MLDIFVTVNEVYKKTLIFIKERRQIFCLQKKILNINLVSQSRVLPWAPVLNILIIKSPKLWTSLIAFVMA